MESSFKKLLNEYEIDVQKFEKFKIHSLSTFINHCSIEVKKNKVLKLLSISELDYECLKDEYNDQLSNDTNIDIVQTCFDSPVKYWLLTKPAQSGKTMEMIQDMIKNIEKNNRAMNILICDNSLIQTRQSVVRIKKINLHEYNKIIPCEISSNKDSKFKRESQFAKEKDAYNVVVMCSKRLENIELLLSYLKDRDIYLYLDEADKIVKDKSKVELIKNIETYINVKKITLTTATPYIDAKNSLATLYGDLNLFPISQKIPDGYNSLKKMNVTFFKSHGDSNVMYADEYLKSNPINPGEIWLIPSEFKKFTHNQMKQMLFENDYADVVCIINSDTKCFYYKDGDKQQLGEYADSSSEMKDIMENFIKETNKSNRIVITGNNCINRGASFQSEAFKFTGTIYGSNTTNPDGNAYQIICRMASYVTTEEAQKLIIDENTFNLILPYEELAFDILNDSVKSYNNQVVSTINHNDMKKVIRKQYNQNFIFCGHMVTINDDIIGSPLDSIVPFMTKDAAIREIREHYPGYTPQEQELNEDGFYITANECLSGKPRMVVSWDDMKNAKNIRYGTGEKTRIRLRPCYLNVKDRSTLRWSVVIRVE